MKKQRSLITVFDPGRGEDFRLPATGKPVLFSSLEHYCVVIHFTCGRNWLWPLDLFRYVPRIPIRQIDAALLYKTLLKTGNGGFFCIDPVTSISDIAHSYGTEKRHCRDAVLGNFRLESNAVASFLSDAAAKGKYEEWMIGSAKHKLEFGIIRAGNSECDALGSIYFLSNFETLGSLWVFDFECGEILAVFRAFDQYEKLIEEIVDSLVKAEAG